MRIRKGGLNLGPAKTISDSRRAQKLIAGHSAGLLDAFATADGRVAFRAVPKDIRKARKERKAQRRARRATRLARK